MWRYSEVASWPRPGPEGTWGENNAAGAQESWAAVQEELQGISYGLKEKLLLG